MDKIDLKIVDSIEKGDNSSALKHLYGEPLKKVRNYILKNNGSRDDANDVFQDAVIALFNLIKKGKYDRSKDLNGFLYVVAKNLWVDKIRKDKKREITDFSESYDHTDYSDHLKSMMSQEKLTAFQTLFNMQTPRCKALLHYSIYEKLSMKEISDKMGMSNENVAKATNYRCKQALAKLIEENKGLTSSLKY